MKKLFLILLLLFGFAANQQLVGMDCNQRGITQRLDYDEFEGYGRQSISESRIDPSFFGGTEDESIGNKQKNIELTEKQLKKFCSDIHKKIGNPRITANILVFLSFNRKSLIKIALFNPFGYNVAKGIFSIKPFLCNLDDFSFDDIEEFFERDKARVTKYNSPRNPNDRVVVCDWDFDIRLLIYKRDYSKENSPLDLIQKLSKKPKVVKRVKKLELHSKFLPKLEDNFPYDNLGGHVVIPIKEITKYKNLNSLFIEECVVNTNIFGELFKGLICLQDLIIVSTRFEIYKDFLTNNSITNLAIKDGELYPTTFSIILNKFKKLDEFTIVNDESFCNLSKAFPYTKQYQNIQILRIYECKNFTSYDFKFLLELFPQLLKFDFRSEFNEEIDVKKLFQSIKHNSLKVLILKLINFAIKTNDNLKRVLSSFPNINTFVFPITFDEEVDEQIVDKQEIEGGVISLGSDFISTIGELDQYFKWKNK